MQVTDGTAGAGATVGRFPTRTASPGTTTAAGDGTWSIGPTTPIDDGDHLLTAVATDAAGNSATAAPFPRTVDTGLATPAVPGGPDAPAPRATHRHPPGTHRSAADRHQTPAAGWYCHLAGIR